MSPVRLSYNSGLPSPCLTPLTASSVSLPDTGHEASNQQARASEVWSPPPRHSVLDTGFMDEGFAEGRSSYASNVSTDTFHFASKYNADSLTYITRSPPAPSFSPSPLHSPISARSPTPFTPPPSTDLIAPPSDSLIVPPPPRGPFSSRSHVDAVMRAYVARNSFDITVSRSDKARHTVTYACVRGGKYRCTRGASQELIRKRKLYTGKSECPWLLSIRDTLLPPGQLAEEGAEERWEWRKVDLVKCHNHPPISSRALPKVRKQTVTLEIREWVEREVGMGTPSKSMLGKLQMQFPNCLVTLSDLRNMVASVKKGAPLVNAATVRSEGEDFPGNAGEVKSRECQGCKKEP